MWQILMLSFHVGCMDSWLHTRSLFEVPSYFTAIMIPYQDNRKGSLKQKARIMIDYEGVVASTRIRQCVCVCVCVYCYSCSRVNELPSVQAVFVDLLSSRGLLNAFSEECVAKLVHMECCYSIQQLALHQNASYWQLQRLYCILMQQPDSVLLVKSLFNNNRDNHFPLFDQPDA